jgi:hypothetical protein
LGVLGLLAYLLKGGNQNHSGENLQGFNLQLAQNKKFTDARKSDAIKALSKYTYKGRDLERLKKIKEKGYAIEDGKLISFHDNIIGKGKKKYSFFYI